MKLNNVQAMFNQFYFDKIVMDEKEFIQKKIYIQSCKLFGMSNFAMKIMNQMSLIILITFKRLC